MHILCRKAPNFVARKSLEPGAQRDAECKHRHVPSSGSFYRRCIRRAKQAGSETEQTDMVWKQHLRWCSARRGTAESIDSAHH